MRRGHYHPRLTADKSDETPSTEKTPSVMLGVGQRMVLSVLGRETEELGDFLIGV